MPRNTPRLIKGPLVRGFAATTYRTWLTRIDEMSAVVCAKRRYNTDMDRKNMPVRVTTLQQAAEDDDKYYASLSVSERIAMVWPLTVDAWTFAGVPIESRLRRDVVRVVRRES